MLCSAQEGDNEQPIPRLVGIGASAGGLEALRELMEGLPDTDAFAYVIAQHVSPTHASMLMSLLAPKTALRIQDLTDDKIPEGGTVYITPPNKDVIVREGVLRLTEPQQAIGPKPSVNHFFISLADALGEKSIGIILSGTGSDGASGMRAIKAAGGITLVQEPDSAKYDGMPKAAIHTGSVDLILRPAEMGRALERMMTDSGDIGSLMQDGGDADEYAQITNLVRLTTAFRLSDYKSATVRRRIARRMNILGLHGLREYIEHLRMHKEEGLALVRDTFISVTAFFRDDAPFAALGKMIDDIVRSRPGEGVIRCWVPGCATGEEAYSIAMLFEEAIGSQGRPDLQYMIFASDLDETALEQARSALYPANELEVVPKALRDRYTENVGNFSRIVKGLRNRLVFARQNVIEDPPFARIDLISCRNLMIYLVPDVQQRLLEVFHYALNPGGHLFLGKSETADAHKDLFKPVDSRARIYSRLEGAAHYALPSTQNFAKLGAGRAADNSRNVPASTDYISMRTLEILAERFAPPSLVINEGDTVVHFQGDLKPYLSFPKGRADMYLFDLLGNDIRAELRALIYRCRRDLVTVQGGAWSLEIDQHPQVVTPMVTPLEPGVGHQLLISFRTVPAAEAKVTLDGIGTDGRDSLIISELEHELANTRTHLNIVVEELETSNEELQSLNEELQSTNEELQSTNEELQTSNEELQSTNEELLTVNEELQVKSVELETLANDLTNVKQSLSYPLIVVDTRLRITQANTACETIVAIDAPLENSALGTVQWRIEVPGLLGKVRQVMQTGEPLKMDLAGADDSFYTLHVMPYINAQRIIDGAVLVFDDVTLKHRMRRALREYDVKLRLLISHIKEYALVTLDRDGNITSWNIGAQRLKGYSEEEIIGKPAACLFTPEDVQAGLPGRLLADAERLGMAESVGWRVRKDGSRFLADVIINAMRDQHGALQGFAKITRDITGEQEREKILVDAKQKADAALLAKSRFLANMSHEIRTPMNGVLGMASLLGKTPLDDRQQHYLGNIQSSGEHLLAIINDILDFSKIEAGKTILSAHDFSLASLVEDSWAMVEERAKAKGLELRTICQRKDIRLNGDKTRLQQALVNFLDNAVKFTEKGSVTLACSIEVETESGFALRFEVTDTGIGMSVEEQGRVFDAFEQADNGNDRRYQGTGLGLAITKRIAQLMGGESGLTSTPGEGSTFWLSCRLARGKAVEPDPTPRHPVIARAEEILARDYAGRKVLVVEDEPINQQVIMFLLEDAGLLVDLANNGQEALDKAQHKQYDIIFMDMQMPEMDGLQATKAIRNLDASQHQIIIAMTANALEDDREKCLEAGMDDFIAKPFMPDDVFGKMLDWLRRGD